MNNIPITKEVPSKYGIIYLKRTAVSSDGKHELWMWKSGSNNNHDLHFGIHGFLHSEEEALKDALETIEGTLNGYSWYRKSH